MITPILNSPLLTPAFDNILPALFGGLAGVYVSKNWKLSIAPLIFMVTLFSLVPGLAGQYIRQSSRFPRYSRDMPKGD